jgi:hypothetical protein
MVIMAAQKTSSLELGDPRDPGCLKELKKILSGGR